ncbi:hypothetical protein PUNSTDRAFT_137236 [Punctularia strigosozonata HHB-11173 SS5]|uniref:uncharacterized protein n=1 Tax=Punctularia strigosozonata (strain HHB-11173) TaxID=741275 RepID=UPI0004416FD8|nr:uncharacterized protein PUNSTDRAFT_137236 [Punctularia strigosozonata HHB-11173 SS5]EIN05742.1 hypothetical protein PUNSTDRAFT_137236 [Punctularia strigosozonata HHB-11173 SS5]
MAIDPVGAVGAVASVGSLSVSLVGAFSADHQYKLGLQEFHGAVDLLHKGKRDGIITNTALESCKYTYTAAETRKKEAEKYLRENKWGSLRVATAFKKSASEFRSDATRASATEQVKELFPSSDTDRCTTDQRPAAPTTVSENVGNGSYADEEEWNRDEAVVGNVANLALDQPGPTQIIEDSPRVYHTRQLRSMDSAESSFSRNIQESPIPMDTAQDVDSASLRSVTPSFAITEVTYHCAQGEVAGVFGGDIAMRRLAPLRGARSL